MKLSHIRKIFIWLTVAIISASVIQGCGTISSKGPLAVSSKTSESGFRYFLAKDQIKVSVKKSTTVTRWVDEKYKIEEKLSTKLSDFTITNIPVADTSQAYYLDMGLSRWYDTDVTFEATEFGILKSINAISDGKTGEVIKYGLSTVATILPYIGALGDEKRADTKNDLSAKIVTESGNKLTSGEVNGAINSQSNLINKLLTEKQTARSVWTDKQLQIKILKASKEQRNKLETKLSKATSIKKAEEYEKQIQLINKSIARMQSEMDALTSIFDSMLNQMLTEQRIGSTTSSTTVEEVFDLSELLPLDTIKPGLTKMTLLELLESEQKTQYYRLLKFFKNTNILIELEPLPDVVDYKEIAKRASDKHESNALVFYRQMQPLTIKAYSIKTTKDKRGNTLETLEAFYAEPHNLVHKNSIPAYITFDESSFARNEIGLVFSSSGNSVLTKVVRKSSSAAEKASQALSEGFTTASNTLVTASGQLVKLQENQRKIASHKVELKLQSIKKQKEILDSKIALQQSAVSEDSLIEKKRLEEELATLEAKLALDNV